MTNKTPVRLRNKILAYAAAWLVALFATNPDGRLWSLAWMFPLGLIVFFYPAAAQGSGWGGILGYFAIYLANAVAYFCSRNNTRTWLLYGMLVVMLFCNVAGCRRMLNTH